MQNQKETVEALMSPFAYEKAPGVIELIQTHISYIFLTKKFVFKVKKAVNFGFLDFSTLDKRKFYCEKELELNRRLCGDMYVEVVPINKSKKIKIKGEGKTVEYALKMKRMPQEKIMTKLLETDRVTKRLIARIARIISDFHSKAETNKKIREFGSLTVIKNNWEENFEQTFEFIGKTITREEFEFLKKRIYEFIADNKEIFAYRMAQNRIRDCHGDIHSGNIFVTSQIYIFDAIEFNDRFRYSDTAADIAFLAMDLDFKGRNDLSDFFVNKYAEYSEDNELLKILSFYKCYRAYIRGKVVGFRLNDLNINKKEKESALKESKAYFKVADLYAKNFSKN